MPVEFLSDGEAAAYGRFSGASSQAEVERFFYLDDADRVLIAERRGTHARLGFALRLTAARYVGRFLTDPLDVPHQRMVDLARYGMQATATALRRHGPSRQLATLLATVIYLEGKVVDDCLEMLDLLVSTELVGKAETATDKERVRQHPKLAKHSATLAAAVETLLEVTEYGEELRLDQVWEAIDAIVPRRGLREAVAAVTEMVPSPDVDADGEMLALLATRLTTVSGFLRMLTTHSNPPLGR